MEKNPTFLFVVAAALVDDNDQILVQRRPEGKAMAGLWEFPGGKVEQDETPEQALVRELKEELDIDAELASIRPITFASEALGEKHLLLLLYICSKWSGTAQSLEASDIQWLPAAQIKQLDMPPADGPLVDRLIEVIESKD